MADTAYSRWYRDGSISITKNNTILTGANTYWLNVNIKPGDLFTLDGAKFYEIYSVDSNIEITLKTPYLGENVNDANYSIIRNFTATLPAEIAALVTDTVATSRKYIDADMKTVQGKSAYEIARDNYGFVGSESQWLDSLNAYGVARKNGYVGTVAQWLQSLTAYGRAVDNGFSGTEAQWLESLLAGGEITKIMKLIEPFDYNYPDRGNYNKDATLAGVKNQIFRGGYQGYWGRDDNLNDTEKLLGVPEDFWEHVKDGSYQGIWLGDTIYVKAPDGDYPGAGKYFCFVIAGFSTPYLGWEDQAGKKQSLSRKSFEPMVRSGKKTGYEPDDKSAGWRGGIENMPDCEKVGNLTLISAWTTKKPGTDEAFNPLNNGAWEPYGTCYGRKNENGSIYLLQEALKNAFGDHVRYVQHCMVSAFDSEGKPSAWVTEKSFCEAASISHLWGSFPKEVSGYDVMENHDTFGREQLPMYKCLTSKIYESPRSVGACREQTPDQKWIRGDRQGTFPATQDVWQIIVTVKG